MESTDESYLFLAHTTANILLQINSSGAVSLINPAWAQITGGSPEAVTGLPFHEIALPDDAPGVAASLYELLTCHTEEAHMQFRIPGRSGPIWVRATLRLLYDTEGRFLSSTVVLTDVTDLMVR